MRVLGALLLLSGAILLAAGCGESESRGEESTRASAAARDPWGLLEASAGRNASRLAKPEGPPPAKVVTRDLRVGTRAMLHRGDWMTIQYKAFRYPTGRLRESVWGKDLIFKQPWGVGELRPGLEVGLEGMRVGGIRELIVPSKFAYRSGALVYLVKLIDVEAPSGR